MILAACLQKMVEGTFLQEASRFLSMKHLFLQHFPSANPLSWIPQDPLPVRYDSSHQTADDYTLMLEGVPAECTSERRLHRYIEKELNMEGRIYGVCNLDLDRPDLVDDSMGGKHVQGNLGAW